jgi:hypothetical protein
MKTNLLKMYVIGAAYALALSACGGKSSHDHAHDDHTGHDHASEEASEAAAADIKLSEGKYTELVEAYMNLKDALVASDKELVVSMAEEFTVWLGEHALGSSADEMAAHAAHMAESDDLEHQRSHFEGLSEAMYAVAVAYKSADMPVFRQYCPMAFNDKGASWLSLQKEIRNPYFGDRMLKCGRVTETLE